MKIGREKIAAAGLLVANVLIVNNYRDMDDDKAVGKRTTVVIFGRKVMGTAYLLSGNHRPGRSSGRHAPARAPEDKLGRG